MVAETVVRLIPLRCVGFRKDGTACRQVLMKVPLEHIDMVRARIEIKCYRCGTVQ